MGWSISEIPSRHGRIAVITGTGGLGYETALVLARSGARIVLAGRDPAKGNAAVARIRADHPTSDIAFEPLDLASLASVKAFAIRMRQIAGRVDLLVNNAGVMSLPIRRTTADGFEMQFGTNYLGHFALTALLLPLMSAAHQPRIVNLSSLYHRTGEIDFDDLQALRSYQPRKAYAQSKLAMLIFAIELHRRASAAGLDLVANAAHPGYARTDLIANGPGATGMLQALNRWLVQPWASQSAAAGAWPTLFAATSPLAAGGGYYGPGGFQELKGLPAPARIAPRALDAKIASRLWEVSERLTGIAMPKPFGRSR